jgi:hypothetical protein
VTQIFLVHPQSTARTPRPRRELVSHILRLAHDMQVIVMAERRSPGVPVTASDS